MLQIDGSYGEGGGQILRTSLFLSIFTGTPFKMFNIRKGRKKPGLKAQHLHILKLLQKITDSKVEGAREGSLEITFHPGKVRGGKTFIDIGTAGSIPLLLQSIIPISSIAEKPTALRIKGGTDVPGGMTTDYMRYVLIPQINFLFDHIKIKILRRGFYPRGGGEIEFTSAGRKNLNGLGPLKLKERGELKGLKVFSCASTHLKKRRVAERQVEGMKKAGLPLDMTEIHVEYSDALSPGCAILILAEFEKVIMGCDNLGKLGKPAETVGKEAWECMSELLRGDCTVDRHLEDNLIPYLGLFGGVIKTAGEPTLHTVSNIWITEKFLGKRFRIKGNLIEATK